MNPSRSPVVKPALMRTRAPLIWRSSASASVSNASTAAAAVPSVQPLGVVGLVVASTGLRLRALKSKLALSSLPMAVCTALASSPALGSV